MVKEVIFSMKLEAIYNFSFNAQINVLDKFLFSGWTKSTVAFADVC